ncbi:MAG: MoxR family ATPase [Actinobacteria bacterium]|nr:MAG: MoxR family ATPase [Actinomycetota bacterium]
MTDQQTSVEVLRSVGNDVVGRHREIELVVAALGAGRHILLEGPPGTGKSTLLRAVAQAMSVGFSFVEGNAELTPARLIGHFDPARVLSDGYTPDVFVDGPLVTALREGSLLYVEEINRIPEETLNVLITVMSEGEITVPRLGKVVGVDGFRLVAAMNPFDAVGTARISSAVYDRVCRVAMTYQSSADECAIVARSLEANRQKNSAGVQPDDAWIAKVVEVVRRTRYHSDLRVGSSVRGAIDTALVASSLAEVRSSKNISASIGLDSALVAVSGRVRVREGSVRSAEEVVTEIWNDVFGTSAGDESAGKAGAPTGATTSN